MEKNKKEGEGKGENIPQKGKGSKSGKNKFEGGEKSELILQKRKGGLGRESGLEVDGMTEAKKQRILNLDSVSISASEEALACRKS